MVYGIPKNKKEMKRMNLSALLVLYDLEYTQTIVSLWKTILR
jgi:hypothetical protein